ncbi:MAG: diacylglycerol kinase family protein [bacterium]|nr:diacylglycerol kinase family protein [bacterium]
MHYYIYDQFLSDKKFEPAINRIEARLTDLGINGKTEKLTILKSFSEAVRNVSKKEITTIVAVGNDNTISKIISLLPNLNVTLGIIPIGPENEIAKMLGIPDNEAACDVLSARIIEKIDLGKANNYYFISHLQLPSTKELILDCGGYKISPLQDDNQINICNFNLSTSNTHKCNPKDGLLEAIIAPVAKSTNFFSSFSKKYSKSSVFPLKKMRVKCNTESLQAMADGHTTIKTPIAVEVIPKKLKIIVGKNRMF